MFRPVSAFVFFITLALPCLSAQTGNGSVEQYFTGQQVVLKIDMPGSQKGVDLRVGNSAPMDWKAYGSRLKQYGTAIRKGDTARVTAIVVKSDRIEFQLDGGGFGTFLDDSSSTVPAISEDKSNYEKDLRRRLDNTTDPDERRRLQRDLDRERARRERQDANNRDAAQVASQIKSQQIADNRTRGGSRFNLRWSGPISASELTPQGVMNALASYVEFAPSAETRASQETASASPTDAAGEPPAQIKRGMDMDQVANLLGQGKQLSESVSQDGLKTQVFEYVTGERHIQATYVNGMVVRYTISSQ